VYDLEGLLCYDEDERLVLLDSDDRELIEAALEASGHVVIADDDLHQPYDGANKALRARVDWWTRFFDYF
jgi:hypothetical protein